jgi:hypothetical protein
MNSTDKKTIYGFPKNCKHNKNGWCHLCVIKEIDASYKRGVEETLKRAIECLPKELTHCDKVNTYGDGAHYNYILGSNKMLKQSRTNLKQLNQTHRGE